MLLPDCTLFPHGGLPLYIFEERYREMLREALEGDCVFSVGRKLETDVDGNLPASEVGTAGLVRACKQREDGTSELLLHGIVRVRFVEWCAGGRYPSSIIEPVFCEPMDSKEDLLAKFTLKEAVADCVRGLPDEVRMGLMTLMEQAGDAGLMSDLAAQQLVHDAEVRQDLLDTFSVGSRVSKLCGYLAKMKN